MYVREKGKHVNLKIEKKNKYKDKKGEHKLINKLKVHSKKPSKLYRNNFV